MNERIYNMLNDLAEQAELSKIQDSYNDVRLAMQRSFMKQYAVLGDINSGKSTLINIVEGEKKLSVSVRATENGKVAFVESNKHNCRWVELNTGSYVGENLKDVESPLWYMDAAVYILSAATPFSQQDLIAIKACVAHGVPCSLVLSKLDMVEEAERNDIITYVKQQAEYHFGSDSVIVIDTKDEETTRQLIIKEFDSAENSLDIRDYMLAISYAKALKEHIAEKYKNAKDEMQIISEKEKQNKQAILDENIAWDQIKLNIEAQKIKLIEEMSAEMNRLYADCITSLVNKAMIAKSPKDWWEQSLRNEFYREFNRISSKIDKMICSQVAKDRDWVIQTVEKRFDVKLLDSINPAENQLEGIVFGVTPERLASSRTTKTLAVCGLLASSIAMCGVLLYPVAVMHSMTLLYWRATSFAVVGTGFWTFLETKKDKAEKQQCIKDEIIRYVLRNRDENIEILEKNIEYGYGSMNVAIQDLQLATSRVSTNDDDVKVRTEFKILSEINRKSDEIVNSLLS